MKATATKTLEVHEHTFLNSRLSPAPKLVHSHEGGSVGHEHPHTGPSYYTIDKDEWFRATGLRGGSRKKFTAKPTGEQLAIVELQEWQKSFELIIGKPTPPEWGTGPGIGLPLRMIHGFRMRCIVKDGTKGAA